MTASLENLKAMGKRIVVYEGPNVSVHCDPEDGIVDHQIHAFCNSELMMRTLTAGVDAMREHRATKWLSDDRKNGALGATLEQWGRKVWFPSALAAGWKFWAIVRPEGIVAQQTLERRIIAYTEGGVTTKAFDEAGPAWAWLRQQT